MRDNHYAKAQREFSINYWTAMLHATKWNVAKAAEIAGVNRCNIYRTLHKLGILKGKNK